MRRVFLLLLSVFALASCRTLPTTTETVIDTATDVGIVAGNAEDTRVVIDSTIDVVSGVVAAQDEIVKAVIGIKPGEFGDAEKEALTVKVVNQAERIKSLESMVCTLKALNENSVISLLKVKSGMRDIGESVSKDTAREIRQNAIKGFLTMYTIGLALLVGVVYVIQRFFWRKV